MADQAYGGFWVRVLAYLVDSVVIFSALIVLAFVAAFLGDVGIALIPWICVLTPTLYWALMQASARQATFGKALLGMKVTDAAGERMSLLRSFGRELAKIASAIPLGLGYVMAAFTGRKQALHDMVASTTVVRESPGHVLIGLLVGVFGWIAPAALAMFIGGALIAVMMGTMGAGMFGQMAQDGRKHVPVKTASSPAVQPTAPRPAPSPTPPAPDVAAAPAAPSKPVAAPEPSPKPVAEPVKVASVVPPPPVKPAPKASAAAVPPAEPKLAELPRRAAAAPAQPIVAPPAPGPKYNDLMTAVLVADPAAVRELLALGKWPDKPDSYGVTPLTVAAMRGDRASAELLLKAGADPYPALLAARKRGDGEMTSLLERYPTTSKRP